MKSFVLALLLLIPTLSLADSLITLQRPSPPPARWVCASTSINDTSVTGVCQLTVPSTARYAQPARYIYNVSWTLNGVITEGSLYCSVPQGSVVGGWVGLPNPCPTMVHFSDTNMVDVIDGVSYWLVGTNTQGVIALNSQTDALILKQ